MTNYTHAFFDALTGETTIVNLTQIEIDALKAEAKVQADAQIAKESAKQAVLDKLGLSADEAQALFG